MGNYLNLIQNRPLNSTKIFKNRSLKLSWNTLGTLLAPRWLKIDTKSKNMKNDQFWGGLGGPK